MNNVWHISGCGPSGGSIATKTEIKDRIIFVNDATKFRPDNYYSTDILLLVDPPQNFRNEPDRMEVIKNTTGLHVISRGLSWRSIFPRCEQVQSQEFTGRYNPHRLYHSKTSTFMAASYAVNQGAEHVVFHGVDLNDHPVIKGKLLEHEMRQYQALAAETETLLHVKMWVSSEQSQLAKFFPIWV